MDYLDIAEIKAKNINKKMSNYLSQLLANKIDVVGYSDMDIDIDASIELNNGYEIQIGSNYFGINQWNKQDETMTHHMTTKSFKKIISFLKEVAW